AGRVPVTSLGSDDERSNAGRNRALDAFAKIGSKQALDRVDQRTFLAILSQEAGDKQNDAPQQQEMIDPPTQAPQLGGCHDELRECQPTAAEDDSKLERKLRVPVGAPVLVADDSRERDRKSRDGPLEWGTVKRDELDQIRGPHHHDD